MAAPPIVVVKIAPTLMVVAPTLVLYDAEATAMASELWQDHLASLGPSTCEGELKS